MTQLRGIMLGLAIFLPVLTLIPLGSIWLWQNGFLLYWVVGALATSGLLYAVEARALPPRSKALPRSGHVDPADSPQEAAARIAVSRLADEIDPSVVQSRADLAALAVRTIEIVAHEIHPNDKTPVWNFTVPEILLLTEQVAARLRPIVVETIPLGEQLTVGQALRLYEWRSAVGVAERAYDVWRLLRIVNPIAAVTQEARERITKQIVTSVRDDLTKRVLGIFVTEIGDAAIDLYGGRLRPGEPMASDRPVGEGRPAADSVPAPSRPGRLSRIWREAKKVTKTAGSLYGRKQR
jgi:uncharacterized protein